MGDKLPLRFLGLHETTQYTLEQSHGPSFSVALDNTTLGDEDSCGYPSLKTVRSIVKDDCRLLEIEFHAGSLEAHGTSLEPNSSQIFQGACPVSQSSSRRFFSFNVSMQDQNPLCWKPIN